MSVHLEVTSLMATWTVFANCNLELVLGPHAIVPLFDCVYIYLPHLVTSLCMIVLTKWSFVNWNSTIFITILITNFYDPTFDELKVFLTLTNKNMAMSWFANLNNEEHECLVIEFVGLKYFMNQHCLNM